MPTTIHNQDNDTPRGYAFSLSFFKNCWMKKVLFIQEERGEGDFTACVESGKGSFWCTFSLTYHRRRHLLFLHSMHTRWLLAKRGRFSFAFHRNWLRTRTVGMYGTHTTTYSIRTFLHLPIPVWVTFSILRQIMMLCFAYVPTISCFGRLCYIITWHGRKISHGRCACVLILLHMFETLFLCFAIISL